MKLIKFSTSRIVIQTVFSMNGNAPPAAAVRVLYVVSFLSFVAYKFGEYQPPKRKEAQSSATSSSLE